MRRRATIEALILATLLMAVPAGTRADQTVVRGVFFFSPTCPHCHTVMERDLPPLVARWGSALDLVYVDVTTAQGADLYRAAMQRYRVPQSRAGVPALFVADRHLVGSDEIPAVLPGLVAAAVEAGGASWPDIPGLSEALGPLRRASAAPPPSDPLGLALGGLVLVALLAALVVAARRGLARPDAKTTRQRVRGRAGPLPTRDPALGALALAGIAISGYLTWVALSGSETVCGPIGACDAVHASTFGEVGGIPVAFLGLGFFVAVLAGAIAPAGRGAAGRRALVLLCWAGALFSLYLTAAEVFAIGAVCSWCLASALVSGGLLLRVT